VKVAVASEGMDIKSPVDRRFGRARYFIIYDSDTGKYETIDNEANVEVAHGAGTGSSENLARKDVKIVVSGQFGPKASMVLSAAKIEMVSFPEGTVEDAIKMALDRQPAQADDKKSGGQKS